MKIALVDADGLIYAASYCVTVKDGSTDISKCYEYIDNALKESFEAVSATHYNLFITLSRKWRNKSAKSKTYKGNRTSKKPLFFYDLRQYLMDKWEAVGHPEIEADDMLAGCAYFFNENKESWKYVIISTDKDMRTVAGNFYDPKKKQFESISTELARKNFWKQMLVGDSTDNIEGVKGIGPVNAERILGQIGDPSHIVLSQYTKKYGLLEGISRFNENFRLLYLLRTEKDYLNNNITFNIPLPIEIKSEDVEDSVFSNI